MMAKPGFFTKRSVATIPLGWEVRKRFGTQYIFRVMHGNGVAGSVDGRKYQHRMAYYAPWPSGNPACAQYKPLLAAAVATWKNNLPQSVKQRYNERAPRASHMSGYNLFVKEYIKGEVHMFIDRGDPSSTDYRETDLTRNGAWHDLDLSSIVPAGAYAVLLRVIITDTVVSEHITFRKNGMSNDWNAGRIRVQASNAYIDADIHVTCDANRVIEYNAASGLDTIYITVAGWWI